MGKRQQEFAKPYSPSCKTPRLNSPNGTSNSVSWQIRVMEARRNTAIKPTPKDFQKLFLIHADATATLRLKTKQINKLKKKREIAARIGGRGRSAKARQYRRGRARRWWSSCARCCLDSSRILETWATSEGTTASGCPLSSGGGYSPVYGLRSGTGFGTSYCANAELPMHNAINAPTSVINIVLVKFVDGVFKQSQPLYSNQRAYKRHKQCRAQ